MEYEQVSNQMAEQFVLPANAGGQVDDVEYKNIGGMLTTECDTNKKNEEIKEAAAENCCIDEANVYSIFTLLTLRPVGYQYERYAKCQEDLITLVDRSVEKMSDTESCGKAVTALSNLKMVSDGTRVKKTTLNVGQAPNYCVPPPPLSAQEASALLSNLSDTETSRKMMEAIRNKQKMMGYCSGQFDRTMKYLQPGTPKVTVPNNNYFDSTLNNNVILYDESKSVGSICEQEGHVDDNEQGKLVDMLRRVMPSNANIRFRRFDNEDVHSHFYNGAFNDNIHVSQVSNNVPLRYPYPLRHQFSQQLNFDETDQYINPAYSYVGNHFESIRPQDHVTGINKNERSVGGRFRYNL